ncbi:MAG: L,D-transpeptidase family protein [Gammaproteobacteria bacterium]
MRIKITILVSMLLAISACSTVPSKSNTAVTPKKLTTSNWEQATKQVVRQYGQETAKDLQPYFQRANIAYPPKEIALLTFKKEQKLELWAQDNMKTWRMIRTYPFTASSGTLGPKLAEGDYQIPEGIYRINHINPFSSYHLSMMVDYPNEFDRQQAQKEGRTQLGGEVFIHGNALSVGCIALGDKAAGELFVLVDQVGKHNTQLIIAPNDLRKDKPKTSLRNQPAWVPELYAQISEGLQPFAV